MSRRLISLRVVVLPEPLRPSRTSVSPRLNFEIEIVEQFASAVAVHVYETLRNSMAGARWGSVIDFLVAFNSSFTLRGQDALGTAGETPALQFRRYESRMLMAAGR